MEGTIYCFLKMTWGRGEEKSRAQKEKGGGVTCGKKCVLKIQAN